MWVMEFPNPGRAEVLPSVEFGLPWSDRDSSSGPGVSGFGDSPPHRERELVTPEERQTLRAAPRCCSAKGELEEIPLQSAESACTDRDEAGRR